MKKILCILLTLIMLPLTACNTVEPIDIPEDVESSSESSSALIEESTPESKKPEDEGDTTEVPKESTSNGDNWDANLFSTDDYIKSALPFQAREGGSFI